jgi:ABC-type sugar transport system ATPase subunit
MITHDLDSLYAICDRVAVLADKKVIAVDLSRPRTVRPPLDQGILPGSATAARRAPARGAGGSSDPEAARREA